MGNRTSAVPVSEQRFRSSKFTSSSDLLRNSGAMPLENDGNVDTVMVDREHGFAFVADGVGHAYPTTGVPAQQREKMRSCWQKFHASLCAFLCTETEFSAVQLENHIRGQLHVASEDFCNFGKSSTFSLAVLISECAPEGSPSKQWLMCASVADSGLVLLPAAPATAPCAEALVSFGSQGLRHVEVGGDIRPMEVTLQEVQQGALVLGLTDGTLDAIAFTPRVIPPPPLASEAGAVAVPSIPSPLYGPEWMERCLRRTSQLANKSASTELSWEPQRVLECLFEETLRVTRESGLDADDCASFAFVV